MNALRSAATTLLAMSSDFFARYLTEVLSMRAASNRLGKERVVVAVCRTVLEAVSDRVGRHAAPGERGMANQPVAVCWIYSAGPVFDACPSSCGCARARRCFRGPSDDLVQAV